MSDEQGKTVRERLASVRMEEDRALDHIECRKLLVDGEPVTSLDQVTAPGSRLVVAHYGQQ